MSIRNQKYASRAGEKLEFALKWFNFDVGGLVCADFGSSTGGFVDCLLQHGAKKVYAIETGYGLLDLKLRNDPRVVVMEKTNAVYVELEEKVDLITIDTGWTKQAVILPSAYKNLKNNGRVISLIKVSFEVGKEIKIAAKFGKKDKTIYQSDHKNKLHKPSAYQTNKGLPCLDTNPDQKNHLSSKAKLINQVENGSPNLYGCETPNDRIIKKVSLDAERAGFCVLDIVKSPILGAKGKNIEYVMYLIKQK